VINIFGILFEISVIFVVTSKSVSHASWPNINLAWPGLVLAVAEAGAVLCLAQRQGWWVLALGLVWAVELWAVRPSGAVRAGSRTEEVVRQLPAVLMGSSAVLLVAVTPRLATQVVVAVGYAAWRLWWSSAAAEARYGLGNLLLLQAVMFESVFLAAGVWRHSLPEWLLVALVWAGAYLSVFATLNRRGERSAAVMAATWALVAAEVSCVLMLWLFMYTLPGGYLIVPQAALVLTALAYCFGSIYASQRQGSLSRARLTEYLLIGLILIAIVITGTPWKGTL